MDDNKNFQLNLVGADSNFTDNLDADTSVLWGVAPTGSIHLGYAAILFLLRHLQSEGAKVTLLLANYHGYFDSNKTEWANIDKRTHYYKQVLRRAGFSTLIETKDFYLTDEYITELFRFSQLCKVQNALLSGQGTLRSPPEFASVSDLLYITTQVLDIHFMHANLVVCGIDESPIYKYGLPILQSHFGWNCSHIYLPMCPGIIDIEMHASNISDNKILLSDTLEKIQEKVELHYTSLAINSRTSLLEYCVGILFPLAGRQDLSNFFLSNDNINIVLELSKAIFDVLLDLNSVI